LTFNGSQLRSAAATLWLLASLALAAIASAGSSAAASAASKPIVIFFGGYASTETDMQNWLNAVRHSSPYGQEFEFEAVPYPRNVSYVERDALRAGTATINATVQRVAASPNRAFIVVGHSSGAALAAAVVEKIKDRKNIRLVILDDGVDEGFTPPRGFDPSTQVECWSVANAQLASFNRPATMTFCRNYHELRANGCRTDMCLHFAIVNQNAPADLTEETAFAVGKNGGSAGYQNLKVNLSWLDSSIGF
jgi:pimeloyl-ACP methyl ester carboxylesterase